MVLILALILMASASVISPDPTTSTFVFSQSSASFRVWTTPNTRRIRDSSVSVPTATGSTLSVSCARNELESFQVIIAPSSIASMTVGFTPIAGLAAGAWFEVAVAGFSPVSPWGQGTWKVTDLTFPINSGDSVPLSSSVPTVLWMTVFVPKDSCGKQSYSINLVLSPSNAAAVTIPISLYVFDFVLDSQPHLATNGESQPRFSVTGAVYDQSQLDAMYLVYGQHRMSGRSQSWPAGLNWGVSWDSNAQSLIDMDGTTSSSACIWANGCDYKRYVLGQSGTWRGTTYTSPAASPTAQSEAMSTDGGRPDPFDGQSCNTASTGWSSNFQGWMCSSAYEASWANYMRQLVTWLSANVPNYASSFHGLWYTINEPQIYDDYTKAAYLCQLAHTRAPGLKVMVSREAHPWIYARTDGLACGYDVWVGHINRLQLYRTWNRQVLGEANWMYFLDTDAGCHNYAGTLGVAGVKCAPYLAPYISATGKNGAENPRATNDGMHYRAVPWVLFSMRISGLLYYKDDGTTLWDNSNMNTASGYRPPRPRISAALFREGLEDYEYLYQANCNQNPVPFLQSQVDQTSLSIGALFASWRQTPNAEDELQILRHELGLYLEGSRPDIPSLLTPFTFPFGNVFFDFRSDPGSNTLFLFNGSSWIPVDFNNNYDVTKGFGFQSAQLGMPNYLQPSTVWILQCTDTGFGDTVQATTCFNNFNQNDQFYVNLFPGQYDVSVGVGFGNPQGSPRNSDEEYVEINDVIVRNVSCSKVPGMCWGIREYTATVTVKSHGTGGQLIMSFGSPYIANYVALSYLKIIARQGTQGTIQVQSVCGRPTAPSCSGGPQVSTVVGATNAPTAVTVAGATNAGGGTTAAGAACPRTCCVFDQRPAPLGWEEVVLTLNQNFQDFDCAAFPDALAFDMGLAASQLIFYSCVSGSVVLTYAAPQAYVSAYIGKVSSGQSQLPGIVSVQRAGQPGVVTSASPSSTGLIVGLILGLLALMVLVVIVVIVIIRKRKQSSSGHEYIAMPSLSSSAVIAAAPTAAALCRMRIMQDAVQEGETLLQVRKGDIVLVALEDAAMASDWCWAQKGNQAGYVPCLFLQRE